MASSWPPLVAAAWPPSRSHKLMGLFGRSSKPGVRYAVTNPARGRRAVRTTDHAHGRYVVARLPSGDDETISTGVSRCAIPRHVAWQPSQLDLSRRYRSPRLAGYCRLGLPTPSLHRAQFLPDVQPFSSHDQDYRGKPGAGNASAQRYLYSAFQSTSSHRKLPFQGRYKAILVQKESYLLELSRYIVLNPLRANMVASLDEWPWSSHGYYIGIAPAPAWLECDWLLSQFGACRTQAVTACLEFVFAGIGKGSPLVETRHRVLLGDGEFVAEHQRLQQSEELVETARDERAAVALSLEEYRSRFCDRAEAIARAYLSTAFMPQIAHAFDVSVQTVSRAVKAWQARVAGSE